MIRIPTGSMPKNTARTLTLISGVLALGVSGVMYLLKMPVPTALLDYGIGATGLGTTLGKQ